MTDETDKQLTQFLLRIHPDQLEGLNDVERRTGINRQASIRRAIHDFLMSESSSYRTKQQSEQPANITA